MYLFIYLFLHNIYIDLFIYLFICGGPPTNVLHLQGDRRVQAEGQSWRGALVWSCDRGVVEATHAPREGTSLFDLEVPGM